MFITIHTKDGKAEPLSHVDATHIYKDRFTACQIINQQTSFIGRDMDNITD